MRFKTFFNINKALLSVFKYLLNQEPINMYASFMLIKQNWTQVKPCFSARKCGGLTNNSSYLLSKIRLLFRRDFWLDCQNLRGSYLNVCTQNTTLFRGFSKHAKAQGTLSDTHQGCLSGCKLMALRLLKWADYLSQKLTSSIFPRGKKCDLKDKS